MLIRESRHVFKRFMYREGIALDRVLLEEDQKIESALICKSCQRLIIKPYFCNHCKVLFCQSCAMRYENPICELCNTERLTDTIQQFYRIMLAKYRVHCKNKNEGCELILYYENLEEHEDICHHERLLCIYPDCFEKIERKNYPFHIRNCPLRLLNCQYCFKDYKFIEIETHHLNCEMKMVQCYGCMRQVLNKFLNEHVEICDEIKVVCEKCETVFKKHEIGNHTEVDCVANLLKNFRESSSIALRELKDQIRVVKDKIEENSHLTENRCHQCQKVSCEVAIKCCEICNTKSCNICYKEFLKPCKACKKLFCPTCYGLSAQHKSCLACGETFGSLSEISLEPNKYYSVSAAN